MRCLLPCLALLAAACSSDQEQGPVENNQANLAPAEITSAPAANNVAEPAAPAIDPKSPEAAAEVLRQYFAAIGAHRYGVAYRLWSDGGRATGMTEAAFAASFGQYRDYRGAVGAPGRMEGAAGSSYLDIAADVTGRLTTGERFKQSGTMTLRRANDVPGATPEQLQWRIYQSNLEPEAVQANFRFAGRWATNAGNCASRAWRITATTLKTPAGSVCSFSKVTEVPGGDDITASCMADGPAKDEALRLRYAESARALLVSSRTLGEVGLIRCR